MKLSTRQGRFMVTMEKLIFDPESVREIMGKCIITRVEERNSVLWYDAISPSFHPLTGILPYYVWMDDGSAEIHPCVFDEEHEVFQFPKHKEGK